MGFLTDQSRSALALTLAIVLAALVSEDGATVTAATLAASMVLSAPLAFLSAFFGLLFGDLGVYALARGIGPEIRQHRWFKRWFAKSRTREILGHATGGQWSLALSRFLPGARVPAYIGAGLNRMPVILFTAITAMSATAWIALVFTAVRLAPSRAAATGHQLTLFSLFGLAVFGLLTLWRYCKEAIRRKVTILLQRITKWEFWPAWLFYSPVALFCTYLGIRYRGFSLPTIANLNQRNGGIVGESKIGILQVLMETSPEFTSEGYLVPAETVSKRVERIQDLCHRKEIQFPFVLKPDTAQRGAGFKKIHSLEDAKHYLAQVSAPLVFQRYVAGPKEAGIFYYRFPNEKRGDIFGITRKEFPIVTGDGSRTLREFIAADSRARLMATTYLERFQGEADRVLDRGERVRLVEAGNHCQGSVFQDGRDLLTEELRATIDEISQKIPGFYVGRYDVRYESDAELRAGKGFQIIELNGAASEATNIYDEANSLWSAYATLFRQWQLVYRIGAANRRSGHRPATPLAVLKDWLEFSRQAMQYPIAD